jgi:riboflavin kinase/FMN adenylyltransferase
MAEPRNGAVTVGNFDGVHRGHAALIAELRARAHVANGPAVAVTFDPHPIAILAPGRLLPLLTTVSDRTELLHAAGADAVVILKTTPDLLALQPREFLDSVFGEQLSARAVVEGFNFHFGRGRTGSTATIAEWCRENDLPFTVIPPFRWNDALVSSSRVRTALETGDVASAADLLGRPYRLRGTVGHGEQRGQSLGFPTANLDQPLTLVPGDGVYAARAQLADASEWPAAVNVGPNPTFGEQARKVEAHLIGFAGNLYGKPLALDFVARLRDTRKFGLVEELKSQIQTDIHLAASLATREHGVPSAAKEGVS